MARITVEDCVDKIPNRFELVLEATKRARKLTTGAAQPCLDWENDKATVLALREIAAGYKFDYDEETSKDKFTGESSDGQKGLFSAPTRPNTFISNTEL